MVFYSHFQNLLIIPAAVAGAGHKGRGRTRQSNHIMSTKLSRHAQELGAWHLKAYRYIGSEDAAGPRPT